jgi:hypothetical protein
MLSNPVDTQPLLSVRALRSACVLFMNAPAALIHLHRAYFARALRDHPANPASSPYGPSFHATIRAVREVMDWLFFAYNAVPDVAICFAYEWTMGLTAAVRGFAGVCFAVGSHKEFRLSTLV